MLNHFLEAASSLIGFPWGELRQAVIQAPNGCRQFYCEGELRLGATGRHHSRLSDRRGLMHELVSSMPPCQVKMKMLVRPAAPSKIAHLLRNLRAAVLGVAASLLAIAVGVRCHAASVGPGGYFANFSGAPAVADWSTRSIAGAAADVTTSDGLDAAVQAVAASSISSALVTAAGNPPAMNGSATWSSSGQYVQTRPTVVRATLLMCTLVNGLGVDAVGVKISYDFNKVAVLAEEVEGQRAYYSLTGAAGSWVPIPEFSSANPGTLAAALSFTWPKGGTLYLLWADDNGSLSPDTACQIDNFSVNAVAGTEIPAAITEHPQSQQVHELEPVAFLAGASGFPTPTLQWYTNGVAITGATSALYSVPVTPLAYNGLQFQMRARNTVSNQTYTAASRTATLTVLADTNAPILLGARSSGRLQVVAFFSEKLAPASVTNLSNFSLSSSVGNLAFSDAVLDGSQTNLILTVSPMTPGVVYTLTVINLTDQSAAANRVAAGSQAQFTAASLTPADIGNPASAGTVAPKADGYDISSSGTNILGSADEFTFAYEQTTGDFDLKVRVASLTLSDVWAKAGLMARESLTPGSRFAAALATPGSIGCFFESRVTASAAATITGSVPVNYPYTWLRLRRSGNVFTGYAGYDGQTWVQAGTASIALPATLYVGMAVASGQTAQTATAEFRDSASVTEATVVGAISSAPEPLGPCSRNTGLVISEIMYHPPARLDGKILEFIELFNAGLIGENLSGYRLTGDIDYTIPAGTTIPAGGFVVLAKVAADVQAAYGLSGVLQYGITNGFSTNLLNGVTNITPIIENSLNNRGGRLRLRNPAGAVLLEVNFDSKEPWPVAAAGAGHSLVLARPSYGEGDVRAWSASSQVWGSPGKLDPVVGDALGAVVINEFLANSVPPGEDFLELYNASNAAVDLSGAWLSDDPATNKFRVPNGTTLAAQGCLALFRSQLGFSPKTAGESLFLVNSNRTRVIDALTFGPQAPGVSCGRYPDGAPTFRPLQASTPGRTNSGPIRPDIVINELMFDPISGDNDDQYIELYNRGTNAVDLGAWRFTSGVDFTFPSNTVLAADNYLVVAKNAGRLLANYPQLHAGNTVGDYSGALASGGEKLSLARPFQDVDATGRTNTLYAVVNEVTYTGGGRWSQWAHGGGSSLELIDPNSDNTLMANWADSDETLKSQWVSVDYRERLDNIFPRGAPGSNLNELQVMLLGTGEALLDDVQVYAEGATTGPNLVANGTFSSGLTGWLIQGNHVRSSLEPAGINNPTAALHLRATAGGDNGANRAETDLTAALVANTVPNVKARARWLRGLPELLLRFHGGGLEAVVNLPVPTNLGTPGLPNSRRLVNAGPAIFDVSHSPVLPAANQPILVTARVSDNDGVGSVVLKYRLDPSSTLNTITMRDDGTGGDALANDGVYTATIPGLAAGSVVAFRIQATDARAPGSATTLFPADAPARECIIRVGDPNYTGTLGAYRLWLTSAKTAIFGSREGLSNEPVDGTFVYNNVRAIYQADIRFRGSPFIRPGWRSITASGSSYAYVWGMPEDEPFLGVTEVNTDSGEHGGRDPTVLREPTAFIMAGQFGFPSSYQRFVHVVINGITEASRGFPVMLDVQQANSTYIASWFPDDREGDIYKIDDWFEYNDTPSMDSNKSASLQNFTTTDLVSGKTIKKQARYRWSWEKKSNQGYSDDYSSLFDAVDACNAPAADYVNHMEQTFNVEEWLGEMAFRHVVGDWDGYGYQRGKNQFTYRPRGGKFWMLPWDLDFALGCNSGHGPQQNLFTVSLDGDAGENNMPEVSRLYNHPYFRRAYFRTLERLANGPLQDTNYMPVLDARYRALLANGVSSVSPFVGSGAQGISIPDWIQQRRAYILGQLPAAAFSLAANNLTVRSNVALISGTAPLSVKTIEFNGTEWPITWTTVTGWTAQVPVSPGANTLVVLGRDVAGGAVAGASNRVTVVFNPSIPPQAAEGAVVFNEIMYQPLVPGAEYVELINRSATTAFDLSGWQAKGLDYTFPPGSLLPPLGFLVLAKDRVAFSSAYGPSVPVFDIYGGNLQANGEVLELVRPAASSNEVDVVVDKVRYGSLPPWPAAAFGTGSSLQLIDSAQDNSRPGNWFSTYPPAALSPGTANPLSTTLPPFPPVWINEVQAENTTGITDNHGEREPWIELLNTSTNSVSLEGLFLANNYTNLTMWAFPAGASIGPRQFLVVFCDGQPEQTTGTEYHANFRLSPAGGSVALSRLETNVVGLALYTNVLDYVDYANLHSDHSYGSYPDGQPFERREFFYVTAGGTNDSRSAPLNVLINEWMADNSAGILDPANNRPDDWFELYNPGADPVDLGSCYLTDTSLDKFQFQIPNNGRYTIAPRGFLLVWADGLTGANNTNTAELHTNFKLNKAGEAIGLFAADGTQIDYVTFGPQTTDVSMGRFPDGAASVSIMIRPTPGAANAGVSTVNTAPLLAPIPAQTIYFGQQATFTAHATDGDTPPQTLAYSVDTGAPPGATINLTTGVFTWTPPSPCTNTVTVRVTDNGNPPLSAAQAVIIRVLGPPQIGAIHVDGSHIDIQWATIPGHRYQMQYKDTLNDKAWTDLGQPLTARGNTLSITDELGSTPQRFYRLVVLP